MKLKQLLTAIKYRAEQVPDVDITDLVYDSRKAVPGCAFVCLRGANADGHKYVKMAAEKGAAVIIAEKLVEAPVPVILTDNTRLALAYLSSSATPQSRCTSSASRVPRAKRPPRS